MNSPLIEDHALLSDQRTTALVTRDGDIDWLCLPRFDSDAVFCSLLGDEENGHWSLRIAGGEVVSRRYLPGTMVLETLWRSPTGTAIVTEFLPIFEDATTAHSLSGDISDHADLIRMVTCTEGEVEVVQKLRIRFEFGSVTPWVRRDQDRAGADVLLAIAGGDGLALHGPALEPVSGERVHQGRHRLGAGKTASWTLTWFPSWVQVPPAGDPADQLEHTVAQWRDWLGQVRVEHEYAEPLARSLLVLQALTHRRTGGMIAAATTSLPEDFGGVRN